MPQWKGIVGRGFRPQEFKDYIATLSFSDWRPEFIVVHNTSEPRLSEWHSHPGEERMRNLESYYRDEMGWSAGPHLFIADDLIWVFTPLTTSGVHSPSWNGISWGVEMVGEYEEEPFVGGVPANTTDALAALHAWRGISPDTLRFHKEDPLTTHKTCPGRNVDKAALIAGIKARMNSGDDGEHQPQDNYLEIGAALNGSPGAGNPARVNATQLTGPARSRTADGSGSSETTGLLGTQQGFALDAVETLTATREGKSLGIPRVVRQIRTANGNTIEVMQPNYAWGQRAMPTATLIVDHPGFDSDGGEASYFGKYDPEDEGTGSPAFGTVQTDSSVFGVALPKATLLRLGLAEGTGNNFRATAKGLSALVEVYNPDKRRLVRVPIVDVGPDPKTGRPVDLSVAAAAFLQDEKEEKASGYHLPNIQVKLRVT